MESGNLQETQEQLRRVNKTLGDFKSALDEHAIVAITDSQGRITYVNDKFCEISQYEEHELLGQDHRILNSGHHPKSFFQALWKTIRSGMVWNGEIQNRRKDGTFYWVSTTIVPFLSEQGNPEQYIAIRADITERKRYEEQLQQLAQELDRKNQELQAVIYAASHDLRSPLVNVQGFASIIAEQVGEVRGVLDDAMAGKMPTKETVEAAHEEMDRALGFILAGAAKMDALLNGLLTISRLGSVKTTIHDVEVEAVVQMSLAAMNYQLEHVQARVVVHELPFARADRDLLGQVFANLFDNALKYASPDRPLKLEISGECEGSHVIYRVRDNGIGIAENHQEQIFDLFHRMNPTDANGHGVGLTIVKRALDRMGGTIVVSSKINKGSVFSISLPRGDS